MASGESPFLQPEREDDVAASRACAAQIDDDHAPALAGAVWTHGRPLQRRDDLFCCQRCLVRTLHRLELVEDPQDGVDSSKVGRPGVARRRTLDTVGRGRELRDQGAHAGDGRRGRAQAGKMRERRAAETLRLGLDAIGLADRATPQAALDEVDGISPQPAERRPEEGEQLLAAAAQPGVAQQREQGAAEIGV